MNRAQVARQIQAILRAAVWADAEIVFATGSVIISNGVFADVLSPKQLPLAVIQVGEETPDESMGEQPGLVRIDYQIVLAVANASDQWGEVTLVGANRNGGSDGRGLLEVEARVKAALLQLGPKSGLPIAYRGAGAGRPELIQGLGYCAQTALRFEAHGTTLETYAPPSGFVRTGSGSTAVLSWAAATRFDARRFILRRASGSTAPATSTDGTGVTLTGTPDGAGVTTVTDSPGTGTWSYSLFAVYDDTDSGTDAAVSAPATLTGLAVT